MTSQTHKANELTTTTTDRINHDVPMFSPETTT
jgi:hypothetical protein